MLIIPARKSNRKYKKFLPSQKFFVEMVKKKSFKNARQLLPLKEIEKMVDRLELDQNSRKIKFTCLFRAIFYSLITKNSSHSRSIASVGITSPGKMFSNLPPVSHVAILERLNVYDEEKLDALVNQTLNGFNAGINLKGKDT